MSAMECNGPFMTQDECLECVDDWYFNFAEDLREIFVDETLNPFIDEKLREITEEKNNNRRSDMIDDLAKEMKEMISEFNIVLAEMRQVGSDFDLKYKAKLKKCENVRPPLRRATKHIPGSRGRMVKLNEPKPIELNQWD